MARCTETSPCEFEAEVDSTEEENKKGGQREMNNLAVEVKGKGASSDGEGRWAKAMSDGEGNSGGAGVRLVRFSFKRHALEEGNRTLN